MLKDHQDAFGHQFMDYYKSGAGVEIIERDDGHIDISGGPKAYFNEYKDWHPIVKKAMRYARGRILDIGCGAGRHSLYLQGKGLEVLGIDISPLAIEVCQQRGLRNTRLLSITQISSRLGVFDTILMLGNNFGLFSNLDMARRLLGKLDRVTSKKGRIIAQSTDPYKTDIPEHLAYHEFNRKRGRMSGQVRIRVRYRKYASPWFDYLLVSKEEMEAILTGTAWRVSKFIDSEAAPYIAIIDKNGIS